MQEEAEGMGELRKGSDLNFLGTEQYNDNYWL